MELVGIAYMAPTLKMKILFINTMVLDGFAWLMLDVIPMDHNSILLLLKRHG